MEKAKVVIDGEEYEVESFSYGGEEYMAGSEDGREIVETDGLERCDSCGERIVFGVAGFSGEPESVEGSHDPDTSAHLLLGCGCSTARLPQSFISSVKVHESLLPESWHGESNGG